MRALAATLGSVIGALVGLAFFVHAGSAPHGVVAAPEAVVEGFMSQLVAGRYDRARAALDEPLAERTSAAQLRALTLHLRRQLGDIHRVHGERDWISSDRANARAVLDTGDEHSTVLIFTLARQNGDWYITDLAPLVVAPPSDRPMRDIPSRAVRDALRIEAWPVASRPAAASAS